MTSLLAPEPASAPDRPPESDTPASVRVLVVDDDAIDTFAIREALEGLEYEVDLADSGEEALRRLLHDDYAVILLDLHMPGMDGYEAAALIRARKRSRDVPIIFLTGYYRDEPHIFEAYSAGAVDVVFKPVDAQVLRAKVSVLAELRAKTLQVERQARQRERLLLEKQAAEKSLRRTEERQATVFDSLPIAVVCRDLQPPYPVRFISDSVERLTGFSPATFLEDPGFLDGRLLADDRERLSTALGGVCDKGCGSYSCEFAWSLPDGTIRWLLDQGVIAKSEDGQRDELFSTLVDATERRSLEEQLAHARKMEAVGQLTGGVAHDFNNLLTVVFGNLDLLGREDADAARQPARLAAIRHAAERGRTLTRQLLAFSRRQHLSPVTLDLNETIAAFIPLMRHAVGETVKIELRPSEAPARASVDPAQLENALLNLAVNARDAMPDGGALTLTTAQVDTVAGGADGCPGPWVRIEVADDGEGMSRAVLERVFEPFFTTKEVGKGSGLGLSQVYGFVRQSGGQIAVDSKVGEGTTVRLYFPSSQAPAEHVAMAPEAPAKAPRGSERVLVVENDEDILELDAEMLSGLGYRVLTAGDAPSALQVLNREERIDLLFSDLVIPGGLNGAQLAHEARMRHPKIAVLLTSGYAGELANAGLEDFALIDKPYERAALAARMREVLDRKHPEPHAATVNAR